MIQVPPTPYVYHARILKVTDGDTVDCLMTKDVGLDASASIKMKLRLYGIDAPEKSGESKPEGMAAKDALTDLILGKDAVIETIKDRKEKYGRYLAIIHLEGLGCTVNEWLIREGHAVEMYF